MVAAGLWRAGPDSGHSGRVNPLALDTEPYLEQVKSWPTAGRHILAHFDESTIVVYQAYRPSIAQHALAHQGFGGSDFSFSRMSWIKPNFLWMMYRSSWGTAEGQEVVLGVRISRTFFESILQVAVPSSHAEGSGETRAQWQNRVAQSDVRLQWDPDHDPIGERLERRAIQLGLRGDILRAYGTSEVREIVDMTPFVAQQRVHQRRSDWARLETPVERVYELHDSSIAANVGLDGYPMLRGQCFCGFVRYEASRVPFCETNCHCSICRRMSGAPFVAWFSVQRDAFRFTAGQPASIRSSDHATRTFCPRCGTPLTFASERAPDEIDVTQCSLERPETVPPRDHTHVKSKLPWVTLCDGLPTFPAHRTPPTE